MNTNAAAANFEKTQPLNTRNRSAAELLKVAPPQVKRLVEAAKDLTVSLSMSLTAKRIADGDFEALFDVDNTVREGAQLTAKLLHALAADLERA